MTGFMFGRQRDVLAAIVTANLIIMMLVGFADSASASDLTFLEMHQSGVAGVTDLRHPGSCSVSADGTSLYAAANQSSAVVQFDRDPLTGRLSFGASYVDGDPGIDGLLNCIGVAVSPDGANVYTAAQGDDAVAVFVRDPGTGALTWLEAHVDGVAGVDGLARVTAVMVSHDGNNVYAAAIDDDAIAVFSRDPATGRLTFMEAQVNEVGGVHHLNSPVGLAMDRQGAHVYAAALWSNAVTVFARDSSSGALTFAGYFVHADLQGCNDVAVAPDGSSVYASSPFANSLLVLARDPATGLLSHLETHSDGVAGVTGLAGAKGVIVDPGGRFVAVLGSDADAISVFRRDPADGRLTFAGAEFDGVDGVDGLAKPAYGCVGPYGGTVYAASWDDDAISVFATPVVFTDGFESGNAARWSATIP